MDYKVIFKLEKYIDCLGVLFNSGFDSKIASNLFMLTERYLHWYRDC